MSASKASDKQGKKLIAVVAICLALVSLIAGALILSGDDSKSSQQSEGTQQHTDPATGLKISYSSDLSLKANDPPVEGVIFTMAKVDPRIEVTAWFEDGQTIKDAANGGKSLKQAMLDEFLARIPELKTVYPNAKILDKSTSETNGYPSAELTFSYTAKNNELVRQKVLIMIKDSDTVVRIAMQAKDSEFEKVESQYFNQITQSATF